MKLLIQNFKCFQEQEISLGKITILAGSNSVGKSSIIQSILLTRTAWEVKKDFPLPLVGPFLLELGTATEILNKVKGSTGEIKFIYKKENKQIAYVSLGINREIDEPRITEVNIPKDNILGKETFYYLNAERIGPRLNYKKISQKFPHTGFKGEATFQLLLSGLDFEIEKKRAIIDSENDSYFFLQQVKYWLEYIIPGSNFNFAQPLGRSKEIEANINENLPTNVGFGISYALPIIVNGLIAKEGSMFIVENPEAHLHPSGQSRIGKFLARMAASGLQVVVETHSEHVINGVRIATLVANDLLPGDAIINYFSVQNKKVEVEEITIKPDGDLTSWPVGFFDQEQRDFAEMTKKLYGG